MFRSQAHVADAHHGWADGESLGEQLLQVGDDIGSARARPCQNHQLPGLLRYRTPVHSKLQAVIAAARLGLIAI